MIDTSSKPKDNPTFVLFKKKNKGGGFKKAAASAAGALKGLVGMLPSMPSMPSIFGKK